MMIFPVERARMFRLGTRGIQIGLKILDNDGGLLSVIEDNLEADWEVIHSGYKDSGALRPQ